MVCTAGKTDGVAPAWEIALYALILLGTDAVLRAGGKRARGDEAASSRCPFASALQAAVFPEKVGASHHWSNGVLVQLDGSLSRLCPLVKTLGVEPLLGWGLWCTGAHGGGAWMGADFSAHR